MIDRLTTALNVFPSGPVEQTLEAIITAIKVIGHGALKALDGLASMRPGGPFLTALNGGPADGAGFRSISADFEPVNAGLRALVTGTLADAVVDRIFEAAANDLVVPEAGVYEVAGAGGFPVPEGQRLRIGPDQGVVHTTLFAHPPVSAKLLEWLDGR